MKNRFIINMLYAFQDRENLYMVMDLLTGGDLRYHFSLRKRFTEDETSKNFSFINNRIFYSLYSTGVRIYTF